MKIDRLISVIMILLERKRASIPELAEICMVVWGLWKTTSWKNGCFPLPM